jgi:hypothetical protein
VRFPKLLERNALRGLLFRHRPAFLGGDKGLEIGPSGGPSKKAWRDGKAGLDFAAPFPRSMLADLVRKRWTCRVFEARPTPGGPVRPAQP